jgi:siroheme synthase
MEEQTKKIRPGKVYLVGAGPGDPGLITVRGKQLLERAEVVVYDTWLAPSCQDIPRMLNWSMPARRCTAYPPQEEINQMLGLCLAARWCPPEGGDPFIPPRRRRGAGIGSAGIPLSRPGVTAIAAATMPGFHHPLRLYGLSGLYWA